MDKSIEKLEKEVLADPQNKEKLVELIRHYERVSWTFKGKSIAHWIEALDDDPQEAAQILGELGPKAYQAIDKLASCARCHFDQYCRNECLEALIKIGEPTEKSREAFLWALFDDYERVRDNAGFALGITSINLLNMWDEKTPGELQKALKSNDWQIRIYAAANLSGNLEENPEFIPQLIELLGDPQKGVRERMKSVFLNAHYQDVMLATALCQAIKSSENGQIRAGIVTILGAIELPRDEFTTLLITTLHSDPDPIVKEQAILALCEVDEFEDEAAALFKKLLEKDGTPDITRGVLCEALQALNELPVEHHGFLARQLVPRLNGDDFESMLEAMETLAELGPAATPVLVKALNSANEEIAHMSAETLGELGADAESAIPSLINIVQTKADSEIAAGSARSLASIGGDGLKFLLVASANGENNVRHRAIAGLAYARDALDQTISALIEVLKSDSSEMWTIAMESLNSLRTDSEDESLLLFLGPMDEDRFNDLRETVVLLYEQDPSRFITAVTQDYDEVEFGFRLIYILMTLQNEENADVIAKALTLITEHRDPFISETAIQIYGR